MHKHPASYPASHKNSKLQHLPSISDSKPHSVSTSPNSTTHTYINNKIWIRLQRNIILPIPLKTPQLIKSDKSELTSQQQVHPHTSQTYFQMPNNNSIIIHGPSLYRLSCPFFSELALLDVEVVGSSLLLLLVVGISAIWVVCWCWGV